MGSSGSNQTAVTQQTQQTRDPWSVSQPYLAQALSGAQQLYNSTIGYNPYSGPTQAPLNSILSGTMGTMQGQLQNDVNAGGTAGVRAAEGLSLNMLQNQGLSPELRQLYQESRGNENPYLQNILNTSNRQISDKIGSSMSGAGRYGSGQHTDVAARAMAEAADPVLAQDYARRQQQQQSILESGLQRAGQYAQLQPALDEAKYAPAQSLLAIGQYQQDRAQKQLEDNIKFYNAQQAYPWEQLARYNAIAGGAGGLGGSLAGTTSTPITQPSTLQKLFGGAAAGAGIGGSFGGAPGAGIGAGIGGLLGML
jgi:hypothetical protein